MRIKTLIGVSVLASLLAVSCQGPQNDNQQAKNQSRKNQASQLSAGQDLHKRLLTLDTHVDIPLIYMTEIDPAGPTDLQVDFSKLRAGGLDAAFFIIYTPQGEETKLGYADAEEIALTRMTAIDAMLAAYPQDIELARRAEDVRRIYASGKIAALIGMENAFPLAEDVSAVKTWHERGVRYVGVTHFGHNQFGDSSNPNPERDSGPRHNGLSAQGRRLVATLNDAGIMVDVSHAAKSTMMQAADLSRAPIIASHSGAKSISDSPRNLDDEQLRKIADVGGVAQMVALAAYVKGLTPAQKAFQAEMEAKFNVKTAADVEALSGENKEAFEAARETLRGMEPPANVADFVDHIDHAVKVAGIDHVGIASDFDGGGGVDGWQDASETANVTVELARRGYSEADIAKIWGGNFLRVMAAAEKAAISGR